MSAATLNDSKWATKSYSSYKPHFNTDHISTTISHPPTLSTSSTTNTPPTRPRSLSPSKLHRTQIQSQHVPPTSKPPTSKANHDLQSRQLSLKSYLQLLRRLKWKSTNLLFSYRRVFRHINNNNNNNNEQQSHQQQPPGMTSSMNGNEVELDYPMTATEAETMFKIDFFEYYVLLERVLVHLLGVFGTIVSSVYSHNISSVEGDGVRSTKPIDLTTTTTLPTNLHHPDSILGDSLSFHSSRHRFHANVLSALDVPTHPLHPILGTGPVRDYLGIAKEFRNRWKDADAKEKEREKDERDRDDGLVGSRYERLLRDLKVEGMVGGIVGAVEGCRGLAEGEVRRVEGEVLGREARDGNGGGDGDGEVNGNANGMGYGVTMEMELDCDASPWEAVDDAMEMD